MKYLFAEDLDSLDNLSDLSSSEYYVPALGTREMTYHKRNLFDLREMIVLGVAADNIVNSFENAVQSLCLPPELRRISMWAPQMLQARTWSNVIFVKLGADASRSVRMPNIWKLMPVSFF